ncbi:MAG: CHAP domain-containing protein [Bifidobacteriaceae bacterium]|jgi:hypothetical protein|nr:CHAP domain-containing protein [Bifidobacteriaceae bacterium]
MKTDFRVRRGARTKTGRALLAMVVTVAAFVLPTAVAGPAYAARSAAEFTSWVNNNNGSCVGGAANCVLLVNTYGTWAGAAAITGVNAGGFYSAAPNFSGWSRWALGAHTPTRGDVVVFGSSYGGGAGHVAVILENVDANNFRVYHQNWPEGTCSTKTTVARSGIVGYIRPPVA